MFGADKGNADLQDGSKLHIAMVQARLREVNRCMLVS